MNGFSTGQKKNSFLIFYKNTNEATGTYRLELYKCLKIFYPRMSWAWLIVSGLNSMCPSWSWKLVWSNFDQFEVVCNEVWHRITILWRTELKSGVILTPTPSLLEIGNAVAVVRSGTFLVLTRSLFFILLELNLSIQDC